MTEKRVPLFTRLPEIYRIKDAEQFPPDPLRDYLALIENAFGSIHENIEALYHDLFIETCEDWVVPYIGDLLGATHLKGDPWTLRADVADTIALRRRKGTLGALPDPTTFVPPATPVLVLKKVSCSPQRVLSLYSGHLQLTGVAEVLPEVKR